MNQLINNTLILRNLSSVMDVNIIPACEDDIRELLKINLRDYSDDILSFSPIDRFPVTQWWGSYEFFLWHFQILKEAGGGILVAKDNLGNDVGELEYIPGDDHAHIYWLYVAPEFRKQGIAQKLLLAYLQRANNDVWVESEDERSDKLYRKYGQVVTHLRNFEVLFNEGDVPEPTDLDPVEGDDLSILNGKKRIIGQYNLPRFDLLQLQRSIGEVTEPVVWGETLPPVVLSYPNGIFVLLTQYIRVYTSADIDDDDLKEVIKDCMLRAYHRDLIGLHFQIYDVPYLVNLFKDLNIDEVEESNDPIYLFPKLPHRTDFPSRN